MVNTFSDIKFALHAEMFDFNFSFKQALQSQPTFETPFNELLSYIGYGVMAIGTTFVVTSFLRLGWFGTWHGKRYDVCSVMQSNSLRFELIVTHSVQTASCAGISHWVSIQHTLLYLLILRSMFNATQFMLDFISHF